MAITIKTNQKIQSVQIKDNIYIYMCVCVCARARMRACNYTNLDDKTFKVSKKIFN